MFISLRTICGAFLTRFTSIWTLTFAWFARVKSEVISRNGLRMVSMSLSTNISFLL